MTEWLRLIRENGISGQWESFRFWKFPRFFFSLGFTAANSTSTSNPFLFFDYIELEKAVYKSSIGTGRESPMMENVLTGREVVYNLSGIRVPKLQKGINIVKYADGSIKKVFCPVSFEKISRVHQWECTYMVAFPPFAYRIYRTVPMDSRYVMGKSR